MAKQKNAFKDALENAEKVIEDGDALEVDVLEADQNFLMQQCTC